MLRARRRRRAPRRRRRRPTEPLPFPVLHAGAARRRAARRVRALPRRGRRACRAASRCPPPTRAPAAPASRSCCGRRSGRTRARRRTRSPTCRCATSTATPTRSSPTARTSRAYVARQGRARPGRRGAAERRRRVLVRAPASPRRLAPFQVAVCRPDCRGKKASRCFFGPGAPRVCRHRQPRWYWSATVRSEPGPSPPARCWPASSHRWSCATSTRAATLWSYRRSPRATSASRGASSSTKRSTRAFP